MATPTAVAPTPPQSPRRDLSWWRDPQRAGLLMTAFFLLTLFSAPVVPYFWVGPGSPGSAQPMAAAWRWGFTAFLAWRVTRGGRISRVLLILGTGLTYAGAALQLAPHWTPAQFGKLGLSGAELALLLSPAVFQRTRPAHWHWQAKRTRVLPPPALLLASLAAGLAATLLGLYRITDPATLHACDKAMAAAQCATVTAGIPLRWLASAPGLPSVNWAALTWDWAELTVLAVPVCYALWRATWGRGKPIGDRYPDPGGTATRGRRKPARFTVALSVIAAAGLAGSVGAAAGIVIRTGTYDANTAFLAPGRTVQVTLAPGRYGVFGGCADLGCAAVDPRYLSVRDALGALALANDPIFENRTAGGMVFDRYLHFDISASSPQIVSIHLTGDPAGNPRLPVFVGPSQSKLRALSRLILAAAGSAVALLGSLACLAWLLTRTRPGSRGRGARDVR
jgi:hypothetical protein